MACEVWSGVLRCVCVGMCVCVWGGLLFERMTLTVWTLQTVWQSNMACAQKSLRPHLGGRDLSVVQHILPVAWSGVEQSQVESRVE